MPPPPKKVKAQFQQKVASFSGSGSSVSQACLGKSCNLQREGSPSSVSCASVSKAPLFLPPPGLDPPSSSSVPSSVAPPPPSPASPGLASSAAFDGSGHEHLHKDSRQGRERKGQRKEGERCERRQGRCVVGRRFREVFAGLGHLSEAFVKLGWQLGPHLEAYRNGLYHEKEDVLRHAVEQELRAWILQGWCYMHFGLPCSSFSVLSVLFGFGSRTRQAPLGDDTKPKERPGNRLMRFCVRMCYFLVEQGCSFSIENPTSSLVWSCPGVKRLLRLPGVRLVRFDQCEYNLRFCDSKPNQRVKKDTTLLTNAPLDGLFRRCSKTHEHVQVVGNVKTSKGWQHRSVLAGAYPRQLCHAWAREAQEEWVTDFKP